MARKLTAGVVLRHPGSGAVTFMAAGSELPDWAVGLVGDHALDGPGKPDPAPAPPPVPVTPPAEPGPPPKSGKGATDAAWTEYARHHGVAVTEEMRRAEVIAACAAAGVRTE